MKAQTEMSRGDFQKMIKICLNDLSIQRTLLENEEQTQRDDMRTLEQDQAIEELERRIMLIKKDYDFYKQFADPSFETSEAEY
ncbi:hypothetical protein [Companilactobacillus nodensis]|uniref:Uncharacterized protein n=1 Tax=Companilactobacillus nodensis DSM 19682 = JCM 14932 = NBRC 107160 TaxID=1423775 RepID=A0A0R1K8S4_9LACO|nr:hypothetical protein [Companilactobacillus nodensis]KRK80063.1 hypothetical protein FD03_GL000240 [Companilactobacillus nodensis DSM 19682 = JCM 14932 = NBRC 107160]